MKRRESFIVQFPGPDGSAGAGALVGPKHVVTCAHVVNTVLKRDQREQGKPSDLVQIAFPFLDHGEAEARVEVWRPPPPQPGGVGEDIAGLIIEGKLPKGAIRGQLASGLPETGARLQAYDPPSGERPYGTWADATMRGSVTRGRLHLDPTPGSVQRVGPGFSGGPVIDGRGRIVALVAEFAESKNDNYPIGADVLRKEWPELDRRHRGYMLLAGGATAATTAAATVAAVLLLYPLIGTAKISSVPVGKWPEAVAVDPASHTAYIITLGNESITVIDTKKDAVIARVPVSDLLGSVAVDPAAHTAYVMDVKSRTVQAIDTRTHDVTNVIPVGHDPVFMAFDPVAHAAYVVNTTDNSVTVINTKTDARSTVPVGSYPSSVAADPADHKAYVANAHGNSLSIIDTDDNSVTTMGIDFSPFAVAVDTSVHTAYIAQFDGNSVLAWNTVTDTPIGAIPVGEIPSAVAVDSSDHTAYVTNSRDNSVSVINTRTNTVAATVPVGREPHAVAVDPTTHVAYVANYGDGTVSIVRTRS